MKKITLAILLLSIFAVIGGFFTYKLMTDPKRTFEWKDGEKRSWQYNVSVRSLSNPVATLPLQNLIKYSGRLNIKVARMLDNGATLFVQLSDIKMSSDGQNVPNPNSLFGSPYLVDVSERGEFTNFRFANGLTETHTLTMAQTLKLFMTVLSEGKTWRRTETFVDETSTAEYTVHNGMIRKVKKEFLKSKFMDDGLKPDFVSSLLVSEVSKDNMWLDSSAMQEYIIVEDEDGNMIYEMKSKGELIPAEIDNLDLDVWRDDLTVMMIEKALKETASVKKKPKSVLSKRYAEAIVKEKTSVKPADVLKMYVDNIERMKDVSRSFIKDLVLFLQENPEMYSVLAEQMERSSDQVQRFIPYTLELDGSPKAQSTLLSITEDLSLNEVNRSRGLVALAGIKQPIGETIDGLWQVYKNTASEKNIISGTALLTLGTLTGSEADESVVEQALDLLRDEASHIGSADNSHSIIMALSNTHREEFIENITVVFNAENSRYEKSAVHALGNIDHPNSADVLKNQFELTTDAAISIGIIESFSKMEYSSVFNDNAFNYFITEKNSEVQKELAKYISENVDLNEMQKNEIKNMLSSEKDPIKIKYMIKAIRK